ncbi:MAG TPA: isocitrate lyase/phosphoenolpyruvate mutase family protein [Polyangiaceae bacterium]|nr:isocitrate lyase/phosphoenolpyruvate mutase family protein [Polyangiaceae bacterium]
MSEKKLRAERARAFRELHREGSMLVLPNVWDAGSARVVESCGATAVATSSAAVAWAHGTLDGERVGREALVRLVADIARAVRVPVTVDAEQGYAEGPGGVADTVAALVHAGAVGINLEDGAGPPEALARKIEVAKRAGGAAGVDLFVNARTDVYLRGLVPPDRAASEVLRRARLYREAGVDGLFVPGLSAPAEIEVVAREAGLPLNVMIVPGLAPAAELKRLGVRRLSAGTALAQATLGFVRQAARELLERGTYASLFADPLPYGELNELFARSPAG